LTRSHKQQNELDGFSCSTHLDATVSWVSRYTCTWSPHIHEIYTFGSQMANWSIPDCHCCWKWVLWELGFCTAKPIEKEILQ